MYIKLAAVCFGILSLTACVSSTDMKQAEQTPKDVAQRDDGYRCDRETVTGSRFPIKRCTTAYQRQKEADEAKEAMRRVTVPIGPTGN